MDMIISACVAFVLGTLFLIWGIYQRKSSYSASKKLKLPVSDDIRETGIILILLGILGFLFAALFLCQSNALALSRESSELISHIIAIIASALPILALLIFGIHNLTHRRIFGLKSTAKSRPIIKKYYKPASVSAIIASISIPCVILTFFIPNVPELVRNILIAIAITSGLTMAFSLSIAELSIEYKDRKKS